MSSPRRSADSRGPKRIWQFREAQRETSTSVMLRGLTGTICLGLLLALVYWGAYSLIGGARLTFGKSFAVVAYAMLPGRTPRNSWEFLY